MLETHRRYGYTMNQRPVIVVRLETQFRSRTAGFRSLGCFGVWECNKLGNKACLQYIEGLVKVSEFSREVHLPIYPPILQGSFGFHTSLQPESLE